ncbi:MAG: SIR2 family protein [Beijerinckiaceae bacterium]|nr:SIR2 family protein [Beijerinckiaceae bacterium]
MLVPITRRELIEAFGSACDIGSAGVFTGAGMSSAAGLPGWEALLEVPRDASNVPPMKDDLPLMAEYILLESIYSRARLEQHILELTLAAGVDPTPSHYSLARLGVDQVWTTNYDPLIERADPNALVISSDNDVPMIGTARKTIIKMHGSINADGPQPDWADPPIITRADFETYEDQHRRLWALLRSSYLSKTLLFLGFSFADANIEILQRLARRHGTATGNRHLTVMRRPPDSKPDDLLRHNLKVRDLENSGVRVHEIAEYDDLPVLLTELVRRTRPQRLFISGSRADDAFDGSCEEVARALADRVEWEVGSLAGPAGWGVTRELSRIRRAEGTYDPARLVFHFRKKDGPPPREMDERVGTAIFHDHDREPLVQDVFDESRAVLVLGGGERTEEEIAWATGLGLGVVPLAASGGAARAYWESYRVNPPDLGGRETDPAIWERLGADLDVAARAAAALLAQAMYTVDDKH